MNDMKLKAKKMALKHFKEMIKNSMRDESMPDLEKLMADRKNKMMKVSVASDSPEGLKKGLSKAEEILKAKMMEDGEEPSEMEDPAPNEKFMEAKKECKCEDPENCECEKEEESEEDESYEE